MAMVRFGILFPELAARETRAIQVVETLPETDPGHVPLDDYGLVEFYCDERGCDCRRVVLHVVSRRAQEHVATINHAFEKPLAGALVPEQTFLDPLNRQSRWSQAILDIFLNVVLADESYSQRLLRHYHLFKNLIEDPPHRPRRFAGLPGAVRARGKSITPPPPRRGKRKKWRQ